MFDSIAATLPAAESSKRLAMREDAVRYPGIGHDFVKFDVDVTIYNIEAIELIRSRVISLTAGIWVHTTMVGRLLCGYAEPDE